MIFGHARVILPAVLHIRVQFHPLFYLYLTLLHVALSVRVFGDLTIWIPGRDIGGVANIATVLLFLFVTVGWTIRAAASTT